MQEGTHSANQKALRPNGMNTMVVHMDTAANRYSSASHHPEKMIHSHTRTWEQHNKAVNGASDERHPRAESPELHWSVL